MSESAFPNDLLSSLASNPDLLKNAMQMASALASSGMLDGLLGKGSSEHTNQSPPSPPAGNNDFSTLLSGLSGNKSPEPPKAEAKEAFASPSKEHPHTPKRSNPPCHNDRIQLLKSVRPFLPDDKREKIDFLVQLLGLLHTAEELGLRKLF